MKQVEDVRRFDTCYDDCMMIVGWNVLFCFVIKITIT